MYIYYIYIQKWQKIEKKLMKKKCFYICAKYFETERTQLYSIYTPYIHITFVFVLESESQSESKSENLLNIYTYTLCLNVCVCVYHWTSEHFQNYFKYVLHPQSNLPPESPVNVPAYSEQTAHALTLTPKIKFEKHTIFKTIPIRNGVEWNGTKRYETKRADKKKRMWTK